MNIRSIIENRRIECKWRTGFTQPVLSPQKGRPVKGLNEFIVPQRRAERLLKDHCKMLRSGSSAPLVYPEASDSEAGG